MNASSATRVRYTVEIEIAIGAAFPLTEDGAYVFDVKDVQLVRDTSRHVDAGMIRVPE